MPTRGEAWSLPAWALTSLKRLLRWKASRKRALWPSARESWTSLPITTAQERSEKRARSPRISLATGPACEKKSKRPRPSPGAACIHKSIVIVPLMPLPLKPAPTGALKPKRRGQRAFLSSKTPATGLRPPASKERAGSFLRLLLLDDRRQDHLMAVEEVLVGRLDQGQGVVQVVDPMRGVEVARGGEAARHHLALHPGPQVAPHRPDEDERPVADQPHLEELPDHHGLERRADPAIHHHVGVGDADELVEAREEGGVLGHLVEERVGLLLQGEEDGEAERTGLVAVGALVRPLVRRPHEPRAAAGDDVAAQVGQPPGELLDPGVGLVLRLDARGAEDRHPEIAPLDRGVAVEPGGRAVEGENRAVDEPQGLGAALPAQAAPAGLARLGSGSGEDEAGGGRHEAMAVSLAGGEISEIGEIGRHVNRGRRVQASRPPPASPEDTGKWREYRRLGICFSKDRTDPEPTGPSYWYPRPAFEGVVRGRPGAGYRVSLSHRSRS